MSQLWLFSYPKGVFLRHNGSAILIVQNDKMKKIYSLSAFILLLSFTQAQVNTYTFSSTVGTYTPITGGTLIAYGQPVSNSTSSDGYANIYNEAYHNRPIGFTFNFNSLDFTEFGFATNGFLKLGNLTNYSSSTTPINQNTSVYNNLIAAACGDLAGGNTLTGNITIGSNVFTVTSGSTANVSIGDSVIGEAITPGAEITAITATTITLSRNAAYTVSGTVYQIKNANIRYETIGAAPNRVLVLQYTGFTRYGRPDTKMNFQIRLYETSNKIEAVYDSWITTSTSTAGALQVGLRGIGMTDFFNRTTVTDWSASTEGATNTATMRFNNTVFPANGLVYTWTPLSCFRPTTFTVNPSVTTAVISWGSTAGATGYDYELRTSGAAGSGAVGLVQSGSVVPNTVSLSGLAPASTYSFYVRTNCGSGIFSAWSLAALVPTICTPVSSFSENFDALTIPALPACWRRFGSSFDALSSTVNPRTLPQSLYLFGNGAPVTVSLPPVNNAGAGTHRLKFWARPQTAQIGIYEEHRDTIDIGYLTNPNDVSSFVIIQSILVRDSNYHPFSILPGTAPGGNMVLAIRHPGPDINGDAYPIIIDDVKWEPIPSCLEPSLPAVTLIANTTATVSWTAASPVPSAGYDIYFSTSNTVPTASTIPNHTAVAGTTRGLSGLAAYTTYYIWIRSNCGAGNTSDWSEYAVFKTLCNPVATSPWTENFDAMATIGENIVPDCWNIENETWSSVNDITVTGFTTAHSQPNFLEFIGGPPAFIWSRGVTLTAGTTYSFSLWFAGDTDPGWEGRVYANNFPNSAGAVQVGAPFIEDFEEGSTDYRKAIVYFVPPSTGTYFFGIRISERNGFFGMWLDDFSLERPACAPPANINITDITQNSATINWTASTNNPAASFDIYWNSTGIPPTDLTVPVASAVTGSSYLLGSLSPTTKYYVWMRTNCSSTGTSAWSSITYPAKFETPCVAVTVPYTDDFSTGGAGGGFVLPACMIRENVNDDNVIWLVNSAFPISPNNRCAIYDATSLSTPVVANDWLYLPPLNLATGTTYRLKFTYNVQAGPLQKLEVKCGTNSRQIDMPVASIYSNLNVSGLQTVMVNFTVSSSRAWTIGFHIFSDAGAGYFSIDDVEVTVAGPIPVTLLNFNAEKRNAKNLLFWTTSTESNNKGFHIERSVDGRNFTALNFIPSLANNGNSSTVLQYTFTDEQPQKGNNYYRLKQEDRDGNSRYSKILMLRSDRSLPLTIASLYPNPALTNIEVQLFTDKRQQVRLLVTDITGHLMLEDVKALTDGENNLSLNLKKLPAGNYILRLTDAISGIDLSERKKFIKL